MNRMNQLLCIHAAWIFIVLVGGAFVVAGWLPPPSPNMSRTAIADIFRHSDNVRIGAAMFFFGAAVFVAPCVAITSQMRRIEGPRHVLADLQVVSAAIGVLAIQIPAALWLAISYRTGTAQSVVVTLNDVSWFFLLGAVGSAVMQNLSIAVCILGSDGSVYPRWLGYANLWLVTGLAFGVFIPFFKTGPLAWNGIVGFWIVAIAFFAWLILMWNYTVKAINTEGGVIMNAP
jgi:hypothetical protein